MEPTLTQRLWDGVLIAGLLAAASFSAPTEKPVLAALSTVEVAPAYPRHTSILPESLSALPFYEREQAGVLYIKNETGEYLVISAEALWPNREQADAIKKFIADTLPIPAENVMFHATHNHQSRTFNTEKFCAVLLPVLRSLRQKAVPAEIACVRASAEKLIFNRRITISPEIGKVDLGQQFRGFSDTATGAIDVTLQVKDYFSGVKTDKDNYNFKGLMLGDTVKSSAIRQFLQKMGGKKFVTDGPVDNRLEWVIFRELKSKKPMGSFVRFSAHRNTCPQFLTRALSEATGGAPCFFMIGTAGSAGLIEHSDGRPYSEEKRLGEMERIAKIMARRLIAAREKTAFEPLTRFQWQKKNVRLEVAEDIRKFRGHLKTKEREWDSLYDAILGTECSPSAFKKARDQSGRGWAISGDDNYPDTLDVFFTLFQLNDLRILGVPGEILEPIGEIIHQESKDTQLMMVELCDDGRLAYVPHPEEFKYGGYEVINSRLSPGGVRHLMEEALDFLNQSK